MNSFKKSHRKLYRSYKKLLKKTYKTGLKQNGPLEYFVTYLKLLRDYYLLTEPYHETLDQNSFELTSLVAAISEYEKSQTCINNYYSVEGDSIVRIATGTEEEVLEKYSKEKNFHWESFWNLVKYSIESWVPDAEF